MSVYQDAYIAYYPRYCRRKQDFIPILPILITFLLGLLHSAVLGAMTASVKEKLVDPLLDRIIEHAKDLVRDRKEDEAYTAAALRNIRKDMDKLAAILKREKAPIANKVKQMSGRVLQAEKKAEAEAKEAKKKKDSFFLTDDRESEAREIFNAAIQDKGNVIIGTLAGIVMWLASPTAASALKTLIHFVKDAISKIRFAPEHAMEIASKIWKKIKEWITGIPTNDLEKAQQRKLKEIKRQLEQQNKDFIKTVKDRTKALAKSQKTAEQLYRARNAEASKKFALQSINELYKQGLVIGKPSFEEEKNIRETMARRKEALAKKNKASKSPTKTNRSNKKKDSFLIDSRLKRSTKRPGRATSWEIKAVLGLPQNMPLPKEYIGKVDQNGNVIVTNQMKPKQMPRTMSSLELDRLAMEGKGGGQFGNVASAITRVMPIVSSPVEAKYEGEAQNKIKSSIPKILQILAIASTVAGTVGSITNGAAVTVSGVTRAASAIKEGIDYFKSAKSDLSAVKKNA